MFKKTRYAIVGLGSRYKMYLDALIDTYNDTNELVGLCDINLGRAKLAQKIAKVKNKNNVEIPVYEANDFDKMITEQNVDCLIVTTVDATHSDYICRAMRLGCDIITEKPMTTDEQKCQKILDCQQETNKKVTVTFNYRYAPPRSQVKKLLMSGIIGDIKSIDFHWMLDTSHGADYYRRWHGNKENSGGLLVHKSTHHFDLINWWTGEFPETVSAMGHRHFYTQETALRYGLTNRGERCHECEDAIKCPFYLDLSATDNLRQTYLENEKYDGYHRDGCVFHPRLDIEDSMNVLVAYSKGIKLTYSLNTFSPWEGYTLCINGSKGRIEHKAMETSYISGDGSTPGELILEPEGTYIRVYPHWESPYSIEVETGTGGHGGGDNRMLEDIFSENKTHDPLERAASHLSGAWSILVGIAANNSIANNGTPVHISNLVNNLTSFPTPSMPSSSDPMPFDKNNQGIRKVDK